MAQGFSNDMRDASASAQSNVRTCEFDDDLEDDLGPTFPLDPSLDNEGVPPDLSQAGRSVHHLATARDLLPEVAKELVDYEVACANAAEIEALRPAPRHSRWFCPALSISAAVMIVWAVEGLLRGQEEGLLPLLSGCVVAGHAVVVAHLAGRWLAHRRLAASSRIYVWLRRALVLSFFCEIGMLLHALSIGKGSPLPLALAAAATIAILVTSWLRHRLDAEAFHRLGAREEASANLRAAKARVTLEIAKARALFDADAVALEQAAACLDPPPKAWIMRKNRNEQHGPHLDE